MRNLHTIADRTAIAQALPGMPEVLAFEALSLFDAADVAHAPRRTPAAPAADPVDGGLF